MALSTEREAQVGRRATVEVISNGFLLIYNEGKKDKDGASLEIKLYYPTFAKLTAQLKTDIGRDPQ